MRYMSLIPNKYYLDDFFDDFVSSKENSMMKCDIYEENGKFNIEIDVPGFNKENINIECKDGYLTIEAIREMEENIGEKKYIRKERSRGKYIRTFYLGDIDENSIEARYNNGTLCICVPKEEKKDTKKIIEILD